MSTIGRFLMKNLSVILSITASAGVIATGVMAAKERPKSDKRMEQYKNDHPDAGKFEIGAVGAIDYIPAIVMCGLTIASICTNTRIGSRQKAELSIFAAAAYNRYQKYRNTVLENYGIEADREIIEKTSSGAYRSRSSFHKIGVDFPDVKMQFFDPYTGKIFERYEREVMDAEYHTNRNFALKGCVYLNEFREFLGLEPIDDISELRWDINNTVFWIDFHHELREDGLYEIKWYNDFYEKEE